MDCQPLDDGDLLDDQLTAWQRASETGDIISNESARRCSCDRPCLSTAQHTDADAVVVQFFDSLCDSASLHQHQLGQNSAYVIIIIIVITSAAAAVGITIKEW